MNRGGFWPTTGKEWLTVIVGVVIFGWLAVAAFGTGVVAAADSSGGGYQPSTGTVETNEAAETPTIVNPAPVYVSPTPVYVGPTGNWANTCPNGSCFGERSAVNGLPRTHLVHGRTGDYYRSR